MVQIKKKNNFKLPYLNSPAYKFKLDGVSTRKSYVTFAAISSPSVSQENTRPFKRRILQLISESLFPFAPSQKLELIKHIRRTDC